MAVRGVITVEEPAVRADALSDATWFQLVSKLVDMGEPLADAMCSAKRIVAFSSRLRIDDLDAARLPTAPEAPDSESQPTKR